MVKLSKENDLLMWKTCGWVPGGKMPDPDLITWGEINRLMDAARSQAGATEQSAAPGGRNP